MKWLFVSLTVLMLAGCGNIDWFPDNSSSNGTAPTAFTFVNKTGVQLSTKVSSDSVTVSGFTDALTISVSGGKYSINGATSTSTAGTILPNQTLVLEHVSASAYNTNTTTTVTVGTYTTTFVSTTIPTP